MKVPSAERNEEPSVASAKPRIIPMRHNQSHEANHLLSDHHLPSHNHPRQPSTEMDIRGSFSRLKKKLKQPGSKRKPDRTGAGSGGEGSDPAGSLSSLAVPHLVVDSGHNREDKGSNTDGRQIRSAGRLPAPGVPEPVPARRSNNGQGGIEGGIDEGEAGQRHPHPHSDSKLAVGCRPGHKGNEADGERVGRVCPSPSTPSITFGGTPNGVCMWLFRLSSLIFLSENAGTSAIPHNVPKVPHLDESGGPSATADGNKLDWRSTVSSTAKLLLRGVRDSADAFGPLKSVAGGLCFILENCEVCPPSTYYSIYNTHSSPQQMEANKQAIESLAHRVKTLSGWLCTPVSGGDTREVLRRQILEQ